MAAPYSQLALIVVALHLAFILWVIAGALLTRGRPWLAAAHIASLLWGIVIEIAPWPCPLTLLEQYLENRAGLAAYRGAFLLHYLQRFVYPDLSDRTLIVGAVAVCAANLAVYARRWSRSGGFRARAGA